MGLESYLPVSLGEKFKQSQTTKWLKLHCNSVDDFDRVSPYNSSSSPLADIVFLGSSLSVFPSKFLEHVC